MASVTIFFAVAAIAAALGVGFLLGHYGPGAQGDKARSELEALSIELRNATAGLSAAQLENADLGKRVAGLTRHYLDQTERMRAVEQQRNGAERRSRELESEVALLKERGGQLAAKVAEQATKLQDMQEKLIVEFDSMPFHQLKATSVELPQSSQKDLASTVVPLRDRRITSG